MSKETWLEKTPKAEYTGCEREAMYNKNKGLSEHLSKVRTDTRKAKGEKKLLVICPEGGYKPREFCIYAALCWNPKEDIDTWLQAIRAEDKIKS